MELKCKSCDGELQKSESVYICERCGETYSANEITETIKKEEALSENEKRSNSPEAIASQLLSEGRPLLEVIKMLRERTGLGLAEAKSIVDSIMAANNTVASTTSQPRQSSGGCYIATCVYGSYDCPQVWTLRRFRDNTLCTTRYGRCLVRIYYLISPTLVKLFGHTLWFKAMWKIPLDKLVDRLNKDGYSNEKYSD